MNRLMTYRGQHDWIQKVVRRTESDDYAATVLCNCGRKFQHTWTTEKLANDGAKKLWQEHTTREKYE